MVASIITSESNPSTVIIVYLCSENLLQWLNDSSPLFHLRVSHYSYWYFLPWLIEFSSDYEDRKDEIKEQLVNAAEGTGFLTLVDHGITIEEIEAQFALSRKFFDLPLDIKKQNPHNMETNNGYEYKAQIRPSTGTPDQKESLWIQRTSEWPSDENVPGFRQATENFLSKCEAISDKVRE